MPYFQNVFAYDFEGALVLDDRTYAPTFKCPLNAGRGVDLVTAWNNPPYNLSINDANGNPRSTLYVAFAIDPLFQNWATISVDLLTGGYVANSAAAKAEEIQAALMADPVFPSWFNVSVGPGFKGGVSRLLIKQNQPADKMRFYVVSGGAEEAISFNARAGIAQLPAYFVRHTIANRFTYPDSQGMLIQLAPVTSPSNNIDANLVINAVNAKGVSLDYSAATSDVLADWQLLRGRAVSFGFTAYAYDGSSRLSSTIQYPAGALVGDLAKKTEYFYTGAATVPTHVAVVPYVLASGDLTWQSSIS